MSPAAVAVTLHRLEAAVATFDPAAAAALAAPEDTTTATRLAMAVANARALGIEDLTLTAGAMDRQVGQTVMVSVMVTWGLRGMGGGQAQMTVPLGFRPVSGEAVVASLGSAEDPGPLWWQAPLRVRRSGGLVVASVGQAPQVTGAVPAAVRTVRRVLPGWRPRGLVEVPAGGPGFAAALGASPGEYSQEAAVTTTVDGADAPGALTRVVVNRDRFASMTPRGARIVLAHELTHVATGAALSAAPFWLVEGFADYVALRGRPGTDPAAVADLAWLVRREGVPDTLPGPEEFATGGRRLAAAYQGAWLACRVIAARGGESGLVRVQRQVSAGTPLADALRAQGSPTPRALVRSWRRLLTHLPT